MIQIPDTRKRQGKQYGMDAILLGGMSLFLLKEGSNNHRSDGHFSEYYRQLFKVKLPHQDTVKDVLCVLPNHELEQVRMDLMSRLFEQKWLRDYRLLNKYYLVAGA